MSDQDPRDQPVTGAASGAPAGRGRAARWSGRRRVGRWAARIRPSGRLGKIIWSSAVVLLAGILIVALTGGSPARRPLAVAKGFSLAVLGHPGRRISLAAYAGRPVIINFFASWCPPCRRETPLLARFYADRSGRTAIVGVDSNDQTRAAERFVHAAHVTYPVGVDPFPSTTTTSYGVLALPQTFFLNARHQIVKRIFGDVTMKDLTEGVALMDGA
jgi:thiol-disulfide isomerase/thioredoxin